MAQPDKAPGASQEINLDEVAKLVDALERDLAQVRSGSEDVQRLRDEVETLKNVLSSPIRRHHWVSDSLHGIRSVFDEAMDNAVARSLKTSQYLAEIGRILGL
jgi:cell division septum initiation protein DivIVA